MAKIARHSKVSPNPNEYILNKKKRLKLFFEYKCKFKFTPVFTMQPNSNIWSYCTWYTWMEHFFIICHQLCSFNANSDLVLSDGCNVYKMRNEFFITFPYLPFLFPLHITGKYKPSKKSSTKFYKILQWIFVKLILIRIHKLPWQQEIKQNLSPSCLSQTGKIRIPFQYGSTTSYIKKIFIINNKKIC